ncbi:MAG: glycosyltransferase family 39 protein [Chloroflexi bacterium]|nr:glycosyltransferase family 39 protein [Chloroflexota bacterium]
MSRAAASGLFVTWEALFVTGITLVASLLRLLSLAEYPPGLQGDEAWMGLEAQRILSEGWIGIWTSVGWGQPTGPFYWAALFFRFLPDDVTVLRASMASLGVATVPVFYCFARATYGKRAAVVGTVLLAFSYWHIHYSRTAFGLISAPLAECAVLFFLAKGLKGGKGWPFVAAGALAGLGVYTYKGYSFFVLLLVALGVFLVVTRPYTLRLLLRHGFMFALPAVLIALPMAALIMTRYDDYMGYGRIVSIFNSSEYHEAAQQGNALSFLGMKVARAISLYFLGRSADPTDGMGDFGLLDPAARVLFALGLAVSLWRGRQWQYFLVLAGVASGVVAVVTTVSWGENRRGIAALPMVFAAAAVGGDTLLALAETSIRRARDARWRVLARGFVYGAAVVVVGYVALWNVRVYFTEVAPGEVSRFAYAYELSRASGYLSSLPRSQGQSPYVYFYSDRWSWDYEARRFQAPGLEGEDRSAMFGRFSLRADHGPPVVYLLLSPYDRHLSELRNTYPGGRAVVEKTDDGRLIFAAYVLEGPGPHS